MSNPAPKYPDFNKSQIRKELRAMTPEQITNTITYHQQKAGVNQRIVAIAKLVLKEKGVSNEAFKAISDSSNTNSEFEQLGDSSNIENTQ